MLRQGAEAEARETSPELEDLTAAGASSTSAQGGSGRQHGAQKGSREGTALKGPDQGCSRFGINIGRHNKVTLRGKLKPNRKIKISNNNKLNI